VAERPGVARCRRAAAILGRHCHVGRNVIIDIGVILGDKSAVTDHIAPRRGTGSQEQR